MKIIFQNVFETVEEIEREMKVRGRSCHVLIDQVCHTYYAYITHDHLRFQFSIPKIMIVKMLMLDIQIID